MRLKTKKPIYVLVILGTLSLAGVGFALNGFFGGGASIPSDTLSRGLGPVRNAISNGLNRLLAYGLSR